jgi:hypothetical protein
LPNYSREKEDKIRKKQKDGNRLCPGKLKIPFLDAEENFQSIPNVWRMVGDYSERD